MWYEGILPASGTLKKTTQAASMAEHKLKIGERVYFHSRSQREVPPGPCQIVRVSPRPNAETRRLTNGAALRTDDILKFTVRRW
jgi:hypothetical protein